MKRCAVKPYEGMQEYIFISYCHKDSAYVFPIIEQMARDGFRIWYDEGIDPGSEWPEIIARHLNSADSCIAFITKNSLNSHNCRREINFALLKKVPFLSVILEPVQMSLGMEMQLSSSQSIFKYTLEEDAFFNKLYETSFLPRSMGEPDASIVVSSPGDYLNDTGARQGRDSFSNQWFLSGDVRNAGNVLPEAVPEQNLPPETNPEPEPLLQTVPVPEVPKKIIRHFLRYEKDGQTISLQPGETRIGRSASKSDYVIPGNTGISRCHFIITTEEEGCYITDCHSLNKTFLNDTELPPDVRTGLKDGDRITVAGEQFLFLTGEESE